MLLYCFEFISRLYYILQKLHNMQQKSWRMQFLVTEFCTKQNTYDLSIGLPFVILCIPYFLLLMGNVLEIVCYARIYVCFADPVMHCIFSRVYFVKFGLTTVEWNEFTSCIFTIINSRRG